MTVYAATSAGLYQSRVGATTWTPLAFADFVGHQIVVDPASTAMTIATSRGCCPGAIANRARNHPDTSSRGTT
jgi:hypothetical protein